MTEPMPQNLPTRWPVEDVWLALSPLLPGLTIEVLPHIDSTNTELMRRARAGHADPILLIAEQQTAGRGRRGRSWVNAPGDCLMYSLGLVLVPEDWSGLSLVVGLAVADALQPADSDYADGSPRISVKWPNDLWLHDGRKLGGTLIETATLPLHAIAQPVAGSAWQTPRFVIIGTGINVCTPVTDETLNTPAAGLHDIDPRWQAGDALLRIMPRLVKDVLAFANSGFAPFRPRFGRVDLLRGQAVHLSDGTVGVAQGVADDGALLIKTSQGVQTIHGSEVSVRPQGMALPMMR